MENSPSAAKHENHDEDPVHRLVAPEANQLHGKQLPPESIGQMLVSASPEANPATLGRSELLRLSEDISIDNTTLRHIYDTHLISENGLRRLVYEHLHGGDMRSALHQEILEHETGFERDPKLRDQSARSDQVSQSINLQDLLAKAGIVETERAGSDHPAISQRPSSPAYLEHHLKQQAYQRRLLDVAFISIILILLILVIVLVMRRG